MFLYLCKIFVLRGGFAEILDNDDGPRVETVHSFCQSILRRFPIEAGVAPHVQLADDDEQSRLKAMARANILYNPSLELAASVLLIAEAVSEGRADERVVHLSAGWMRGDARGGA